MRKLSVVAMAALTAVSGAQHIEQVVNRDTNDPFRLKSVKTESTVVGPIVRTSTLLTYENPYKKLTEASLWFNLPEAATLGGFGYYFKDEYVRGKLMDKAKAWFIYTAITSRNEDPGIMTQVTPSSYHAQIYPLAIGHDLRVRLWTVGFVQPHGNRLNLPIPDAKPPMPEAVVRDESGRIETAAVSHEAFKPEWKVRATYGTEVERFGDGYSLAGAPPKVHAVAQRFKDGRTYVAGIVRSDKVESEDQNVTFAVLRQPRYTQLNENHLAFMGWLPRSNKKVALRFNGERVAFRPQRIHKGSEAARLWAHQRLAQDEWRTRRDVLRFSMKYGIPSTATALLAVPNEQMKLFRAKEREWQRQEAARRRAERAEERRNRNWQEKRQQNWSSSSGGDPEIRVSMPDAERAYAQLPDGRILTLRAKDGVWGGNFDIPADAPEGKYTVKVFGVRRDGSREERTLSYDVDRTAPEGKATLERRNGRIVLTVRAEADLPEVAAYFADGERVVLEEKTPGVYTAVLDRTPNKVVLKDSASNKREIACSWRS
jgi:hypothetical protein